MSTHVSTALISLLCDLKQTLTDLADISASMIKGPFKFNLFKIELIISPLKNRFPALAGVAHWIECQPVYQEVASSIPAQDTCLGCGQGPQLGVFERQPIDVSLTNQCSSPSFSLPSPLYK